DETTLAAVVGQANIRPAFDRLARLSVAHPTEHGLRLHDDVRRALAMDLGWRRPQRVRELRLRALAYYRERMRDEPAAERAWLLAERLFLCGDAVVQRVLFSDDEPATIWVEVGQPEDLPEALVVWDRFLEEVLLAKHDLEFDQYSRAAVREW